MQQELIVVIVKSNMIHVDVSIKKAVKWVTERNIKGADYKILK